MGKSSGIFKLRPKIIKTRGFSFRKIHRNELYTLLETAFTERFLKSILSDIVIKQFFILFLILVISCILSIKSNLAKSFPMYPLSAKSFPNILSKNRCCFKGLLSSSLACVMVKVNISHLYH